MQMTAIYWLYAGIALILFEIMTPGLVSLFFGLSALTVALIAWLIPGFSQGWQWAAFSVFSILYILLLRKSMKNVFSGDRAVSDNPRDEYTGKLAVVTETIAPNRPGRVEVNGTTWTAESGLELTIGASVRIIGQKNLTFTVDAV